MRALHSPRAHPRQRPYGPLQQRDLSVSPKQEHRHAKQSAAFVNSSSQNKQGATVFCAYSTCSCSICSMLFLSKIIIK